MADAPLAPRRIVVKLGTNVIMRPDGRVALGLLCGLVESIAALRELGHQFLVVSSGSIGLGVERLGLPSRPTDLAQIQACAATGQSRLMSIYEDSFDRLGCRTAQVLLTEDDFRSPTRHANLARTLHALLELGVIPVINENDTVSVAELDTPLTQLSDDDASPQGEAPGSPRDSPGHPQHAPGPRREKIFGDNDKLSALVATHIRADLLVLLSDVDGLFDRPPSDPAATLLREVPLIDDSILTLAHGGNGRGRGGMLSKLEAARLAQTSGLSVVIANGRTPQVLERILARIFARLSPTASAGLKPHTEAETQIDLQTGTLFPATAPPPPSTPEPAAEPAAAELSA